MADFRLEDDSEGDREVAEWRQDLAAQNDPLALTRQQEMDEFHRLHDKMHKFPDIIMPEIIDAGLAVQAQNEGIIRQHGDEHILDRKGSTRYVLYSADRIDEVSDMVAGALAKVGTEHAVRFDGMQSDYLVYFSHILEGMKQGMAAVKANQQARGL